MLSHSMIVQGLDYSVSNGLEIHAKKNLQVVEIGII